MTKPTRRTSRSIATIWPLVSKGAYGQTSYGAPYTVKCTYEKGSSKQYRDAQGQLYIPASIYWYELPTQGIPSLTDYIAVGDHTLLLDPNSVQGAEIIKNAIQQDSSILNDIPDLQVMT